MKKYTIWFLLILLSFGAANIFASGDTASSNIKREKFDPLRDPAKDLVKIIKKAKSEKKNILLDIGGEWCPWCRKIDEFIELNPSVKQALLENFIVMKVNVSKENKNEKFLVKYPKVDGYPHYFVLAPDGKLLLSQGTDVFENGKTYDDKKLIEFFNKWKKSGTK